VLKISIDNLGYVPSPVLVIIILRGHMVTVLTGYNETNNSGRMGVTKSIVL
jgi:hypothetical protein